MSNPTLYEYALVHHCHTCGAPEGQPCNAPRKQAEWRALGSDPATLYRTLHVTRQDMGVRYARSAWAGRARPLAEATES